MDEDDEEAAEIERQQKNRQRQLRRSRTAQEAMSRRHCDVPTAYSTSGRRVFRKPPERDQDSEDD